MDWPVVLALGAVVVALAWRRRDRDVLWLATVVAVGLAAAIVGVHGVVGVVYPYLVQWTWVLGAMLGILIVWGAVRAIPRETVGSAARTTAWCTASVALVALAVAGVVGAVRADVPDASAQSLVRSVRDQVLSQVDVRGRTVQVEGAPSDFNLWSLVLQFERRGAHVRVSPAAAFYVGPWLLRGPAKPDTTLDVGGEPPPPGRVVARYVRPYPARVVRAAAQAVATARRRFGPASKEVRLFERRLRFVTTQPEVAVAVVER